MAAPALAIYAFLYLYPSLSNLRYSTTRWDGVTEPIQIGLRNFTYLLTNDDLFMKVLGNNFLTYCCRLPDGFCASLRYLLG